MKPYTIPRPGAARGFQEIKDTANDSRPGNRDVCFSCMGSLSEGEMETLGKNYIEDLQNRLSHKDVIACPDLDTKDGQCAQLFHSFSILFACD